MNEHSLAWSTPRECVRLFAHGVTVRTAGRVALVVGTLLSAVNQGSTIVDGDATWITWVRVAVNYCVPFVVASIGVPLGVSSCSDRSDPRRARRRLTDGRCRERNVEWDARRPHLRRARQCRARTPKSASVSTKMPSTKRRKSRSRRTTTRAPRSVGNTTAACRNTPTSVRGSRISCTVAPVPSARSALRTGRDLSSVGLRQARPRTCAGARRRARRHEELGGPGST